MTDTERHDNLVNTGKQMLAGGGAGALSKTSVAPFERIKILCQNGKAKKMWPTGMRIYKEEGIIAFWKGNNANVLRVIPNRALLFATNDWLKEELAKSGPAFLVDNTTLSSTLTGAIAGAAAVVSTYPLDLIRGRMGGLFGKTKYNTMWSTCRVTVSEEGFRALFKGVFPTVIGSLPYEGLKFGIYDTLMAQVPALQNTFSLIGGQLSETDKPHVQPPVSLGWSLIMGGIAGAGSGTITYPFDTVRRRMQMQGTETVVDIGKYTYKNSFDCCVKMVRYEGISSLFAGVVANFWRVSPSVAVQFAAYAWLKDVLNVKSK